MSIQERIREWDVYLVMDLAGYGSFTALDLALQALDGGVRVIQIREKKLGDLEFLRFAGPIQRLCQERGAAFIINDRMDLAVQMKADGVHLGQDDLPHANVRDLIGTDMILGISASSIEEAERGIKEGADYLGVGSIYPTFSKNDAGEAVTPNLVSDIRHFTKLPIVGIGGIKQGLAAPVIHAGGNAVAVISAITHADSPQRATEALIEEIKQAKINA